MENDQKSVAVFDPRSLADTVRDRICAEFVGLIPKEQWTAMVQQEINSFMHPEPLRWSGDARRPSGFSTVVREVLTKELAEMVREELRKMTQLEIDVATGRQSAPAVLKDLIIQEAPTIFSGMLVSAVRAVLASAEYRVGG